MLARMTDEALVRLPDRIELSLAEVQVVLAAVDHGRELAPSGSAAAAALRRADRLLVGKVWPELGSSSGTTRSSMRTVEHAPLECTEPLSTLEAARQLDVDVATVYGLIFRGELRGGPDRTGDVQVDAASVREVRSLATDATR